MFLICSMCFQMCRERMHMLWFVMFELQFDNTKCNDPVDLSSVYKHWQPFCVGAKKFAKYTSKLRQIIASILPRCWITVDMGNSVMYFSKSTGIRPSELSVVDSSLIFNTLCIFFNFVLTVGHRLPTVVGKICRRDVANERSIQCDHVICVRKCIHLFVLKYIVPSIVHE